MFALLVSVTVVVFGLCLACKAVQLLDLYFRVPARPLQQYMSGSSTNGPARDSEGANAVSWAFITGSSDGIGYAFADYLLSCGFGVIIAANEGVGNAMAKLSKLHPNANIAGYTIDCMKASVLDIESLVKEVSGYPIRILVNNVGGIPTSEPKFRPFEEYEAQDIDDVINLNARFMTHLTRLMIPILKKGSQSRSLILNISSAARFGNPYISLYSASKAYVTSLSHTIARECKAFSIPIDCLLIVAGEVRTPGNRAGYAKGTPSAAEYAKIALERVDKAIALGMLEIAPFWTHAIQLAVASVVPESILSSTAVKMAEGKRDAFAKMQ